MPSFVIHIAVAQEYQRNYPEEIKRQEDFWKGIIAPDLGKNREERDQLHYVKNSDNVLYQKFFKEHEIINDYEIGYLLHLITDEAFYCYWFEKELQKVNENQDDFYHDYDCINQELLSKYKIPLLPEIKDYVKQINEEPRYLELEKVLCFIQRISNISLQEQMKQIKEKEKIIEGREGM